MKDITKVLFIRLGGIGDIVFTLPAIYMASENLPQAKFVFLTSKAYAPILKGFPNLDQILIIDKDIYHRKNLKEICQNIKELFAVLKKEKYDLVVDFQSFGETSLISWLSGAPSRWGITHRNLRDRVYTVKVEELQGLPKPHQVDIYRKLLEKGGLKEVSVKNLYKLPEEELQKARNLFQEYGYTSSKPTIFIQPFSNYAEKNWPLDNYYTIAKYFQNLNIQIIFGGGPSDLKALQQITGEFPTSAGKANLLTTAGLMKLSNLVVGGDTGLLHLAVAMEKRVLMLMATTKPKEYGPYGHPEWAIAPENSYNIKDLKTDSVIKMIKNIIR